MTEKYIIHRRKRFQVTRAALYFESLDFPPPSRWKPTRGLDRREWLMLMTLVAAALEQAEKEAG